MKRLTVPLSAYHQQQLAELRTQAAQLKRDEQTILKTILGTRVAPNDPMWGWSCDVRADALVLTPKPAE